jgi:hypothetical protein
LTEPGEPPIAEDCVLGRLFRTPPAHAIETGVDHQPVQPRREGGVATEPRDVVDQLQEHLLRHVVRRLGIAVKEIERDGIHAIFVRLVERTESVAVAAPARLDDRGIDPRSPEPSTCLLDAEGGCFFLR